MPDTPRNASHSARARVRAEVTAEILEAARRQLADVGPASLSLRAVARDVGMVSSAVYRYFASREDLLTALIIDAYNDVGAAAEATETTGRVALRWLHLARAIRTWAITHPQQYALIYGSPVPGYRAPTGTVDPATRVILVAMRLVADGIASGEIDATERSPAKVTRTVHTDFDALRAVMPGPVPDAIVSRIVAAWTQLFGTISFELFGHLHNVINDYDAFFGLQMRNAATFLIGEDR